MSEDNKNSVININLNQLNIYKPAKDGDLDTVKDFIQRGADVNRGALAAAAGGGHLEIVRALMKAGADPQDSNSTAVARAAGGGHLQVMRELMAAGGDFTDTNCDALECASRHGHLECVKELLNAGADAEANGSAALEGAARHGHLECLKAVLNAGANPKAVDSRAMRAAAEKGHVECVKELLPVCNIENWSESDWDQIDRRAPEMQTFIKAYYEQAQLRANLPSVADEMQGQGLKQSRGRRL